MKHLILSIFTSLFSLAICAQSVPDLPEFHLERETFETHLRHLASDELAGRRTASEGGEQAARYIAGLFENYGLKPAPGAEDFFQEISFDVLSPPQTATLTIGEVTFNQGEELLLFRGAQTDLTTGAVFAGHGWVDEETGHDDYAGLDVEGKIVFLLPGKPGGESVMENFKVMPEKKRLAMEQGASGIIELFRSKYPWRFFKSYFAKERMEVASGRLDEEGSFFYGVIKEGSPNPVKTIEAGEEVIVSFRTSGIDVKRVKAANVVGVVEGTDATLKNEYVAVSAHYDHVGVGSQGGVRYTPQDSIFNGARDNAMGTVALLAAAKALGERPAKRSVIFLAFTGEEMGMIGSDYYVNHPLVPLEQTVFNLNNDGAGYNSTEHFTVVGYERTNVATELEQAAIATGLAVTKDPAPEQNLYERSDNISFAKKGIPAIDIAPGVLEMNEEIFKYYHQASDNPETIDYDYLLDFCRTFAHTARLIADKNERPEWTPGDKFAPVKKALPLPAKGN